MNYPIVMEKDRKLAHIELAFDSQTDRVEQDSRFIYEPLLAAHPTVKLKSFPFLAKTMKAPIWVSSMTGGTGIAKTINQNIARACREFGLGMGLGSCRKLLFDKTHWADFNVRDILGDEQPFWANLGIAQVEKLLSEKKENAIVDLLGELRADGLIIHVNPLQEWFQLEGDRIEKAPLDTIKQLIKRTDIPLIVKEVGQGMGKESLSELLQLPLSAIEFSAFGGTNFSKLEMMRDSSRKQELFEPYAYVGQTAEQMVCMVNELLTQIKEPACKELIISGGVKNYLDGYHLVAMSKLPAVYGMASSVLKMATGDYAVLKEYLNDQIEAYRLAEAYLRLNPNYEEQ